MSSFTTPLIVCLLDDGNTWKLMEPFDYSIGDLSSGWKIEVPAGFVTDFASVPRILWNILPPTGKYGKAAVLHDWLYHRQEYTRAFTDSIFAEAMDALGVPAITRGAMYLGVRIGGWVAWNQHKRENAEAAAKAKEALCPKCPPKL